MNASTLPKLSQEAHKRIKQALEEAQARLRNAVLERALKAKLKPASINKRLNDRKTLLRYCSIDLRTSAAVQYLDAMAWEYMTSMSATEFGALIGEISEKVSRAFDIDGVVVNARNQHWIDEARDRAANGISGERIPLRIDSKQVLAFRELQRGFSEMEKSGPELRASFADGGRVSIVTDGPYDPQRNHIHVFIRLARQALAALGFKFTNSSRAVYYWLDLIRQEAPHRYKRWRIPALCAASAELCMEFETRAREAGTSKDERASAGEVEPVNGCSTPQPVDKRKRGRPPLPLERKTAAAKLKATGSSNKQVASVLYNNPYPTSQQTKNVSTVLRYWQKSKQSSSQISPGQTAPKPRKTRG